MTDEERLKNDYELIKREFLTSGIKLTSKEAEEIHELILALSAMGISATFEDFKAGLLYASGKAIDLSLALDPCETWYEKLATWIYHKYHDFLDWFWGLP